MDYAVGRRFTHCMPANNDKNDVVDNVANPPATNPTYDSDNLEKFKANFTPKTDSSEEGAK